jgi:hypothetical protein
VLLGAVGGVDAGGGVGVGIGGVLLFFCWFRCESCRFCGWYRMMFFLCVFDLFQLCFTFLYLLEIFLSESHHLLNLLLLLLLLLLSLSHSLSRTHTHTHTHNILTHTPCTGDKFGFGFGSVAVACATSQLFVGRDGGIGTRA